MRPLPGPRSLDGILQLLPSADHLALGFNHAQWLSLLKYMGSITSHNHSLTEHVLTAIP